MSTETKSWQSVQALLGDAYKMGDNCLYTETEAGLRIEVTGTCNQTFKRHFNVYLIYDGNEIGQAVGVPQEKLVQEIDALRKLSCVK